MNKMILTVVSIAALAMLSGCAEKKSCCNPPAPVAAPAPVVEAPAPAPAPVVVAPAPVVEEVAPVVVDEKTRAVQ
jgi:uncharacterized lipoprotein YajG